MSIEYREPGSDMIAEFGGDPLASLVVPVCCVPGVLGAGLARAFAERWPHLVCWHRESYGPNGRRAGPLFWGRIKVRPPEPGSVVRVPPALFGGRPAGCGFAFAATKNDWRDRSRLEWVSSCCEGLAGLFAGVSGKIVCVPALGCGLGGLRWADVKPLIHDAAAECPECRWVVYPPFPERMK